MMGNDVDETVWAGMEPLGPRMGGGSGPFFFVVGNSTVSGSPPRLDQWLTVWRHGWDGTSMDLTSPAAAIAVVVHRYVCSRTNRQQISSPLPCALCTAPAPAPPHTGCLEEQIWSDRLGGEKPVASLRWLLSRATQPAVSPALARPAALVQIDQLPGLLPMDPMRGRPSRVRDGGQADGEEGWVRTLLDAAIEVAGKQPLCSVSYPGGQKRAGLAGCRPPPLAPCPPFTCVPADPAGCSSSMPPRARRPGILPPAAPWCAFQTKIEGCG